MVKPLSEHSIAVLEFIKAHPGVQAQVIAAELNIKAKDLMIALTILQGRGLIEGKLDLKFDKRKHSDDSAVRFYAEI
jgi:DNA-binding MarR family transcriptional regulator